MPLTKSTSKKAFEKNVAAEVKAGRPTKQAVAIAYSVKRQAAKKGSPDFLVEVCMLIYSQKRINVWKGKRHDDLFDGEEAVLNGRPSFLALCP